MVIKRRDTGKRRGGHRSYTGGTEAERGGETQEVHREYKGNTREVHGQYTGSTQAVHRQYTGSTQAVPEADTEGLMRPYTANAAAAQRK